MAVTKQTYTATATWTASQLAALFEDAFIDAGLMTAWYDSFLSGTIQNRILEVVYDGSKTYGTTYYWFMFTTGGVFLHTALGWDEVTHVPTGTQYLDYVSAATNATSSHYQLVALSSTTACTLTRYTSGIDTDCSWFLIRNGTTAEQLFVPSAGFGPSSFVDLSKVAFNGCISLVTSATSPASFMTTQQVAGFLRRTYLGAVAFRSGTSGFSSSIVLQTYGAFGNSTVSSSNYSTSVVATWLPAALTTTHADLASNHTPVFTAPSIHPYTSAMPADFGLAAYYASNTMAVQDTLIVSAGVEEWEMLEVALNTNTNGGRLLFLARTT
jgi:hypothetical protein